jgi:hypothetical protein
MDKCRLFARIGYGGRFAFRSVRDEVTGKLRRLDNQKLHELSSVPNIIQVMK